MRRTKRRVKHRGLFTPFQLAVALLTSLLVAVCLDLQLRPIMQTAAAAQAQTLATRAINDAIAQQLAEEQITYASLVCITKNDTGDITSVQADIAGINRLRASITNAVSDRLQQVQEQEIRLPIGTLLGSQYFSGRGPSIDFKILPVGAVISDVSNVFEAAGINQTHHQIRLHISTTVTGIIPGCSVNTLVETSVSLAETVIVGNVPNAYTQIQSGTTDPVDKFLSYGFLQDDPPE